MVFDKLTQEIKVFQSHPRDMRVLLLTNMTFAWVLPIVEIFIGAYIMRKYEHEPDKAVYVAMFQLAQYVGIVFTSVGNGWLLKHVRVAHLYCCGILLSALSLMGMMLITDLTAEALVVLGVVMGAALGVFWTNRYLITLKATPDDNRNYFFGLESLGFTVGQIAVPLLVGALFASLDGSELMGVRLDVAMGYRIVTGIATLVALVACANTLRGNFPNPEAKRFFYLRFDLLWRKMLLLASLKGMVQGFLVTAPAILIMKFFGDEGALGLIQGVSGGLTAILVYVLGRVTKPKHRTWVFGAGLVLFLVGTVVNGLAFCAWGVIVFVLCKVIFQPLHDLAYFPIMMRTIDIVSRREQRDEYTYIMTHELGLFVGRAFGLILFMALAFGVSEDFALMFALPIVAALQMLSLPLARNITKERE